MFVLVFLLLVYSLLWAGLFFYSRRLSQRLDDVQADDARRDKETAQLCRALDFTPVPGDSLVPEETDKKE